MGSHRRQWSALCASVIVAGAAFVVAIQPASASQDYNDYLVYGTNGVHIGFESTIHGLTGSKHNRTEKPNPHESIRLDGGAHIDGDAIAGQDVNMQNKTGITGTLTMSKNAKLKISSTSSLSPGSPIRVVTPDLPGTPIPTHWPAAQANYCNTQHAGTTYKGGATITLTPGTYGPIKGGSGKLVFNGSGNYVIDRVDLGKVALTFQNAGAGINIFVCSKFHLAAVSKIAPANISSDKVYVEVKATPKDRDTNGFEVGNGDWIGNVVAPTSGVHIGSGGSQASFTGHMWADHIDLEHSVDVLPGPPPNFGSSSTTTSVITIPT